jgi:hypothetical protein
MCASNDLTELRKLQRKIKPIRAWKVLRKSGLNIYTGYGRAKYGPGQVKAAGVTPTTLYLMPGPRGLHVYRTKRVARHMAYGFRVAVPVYINPSDLIAAEPSNNYRCAQLVACRLTIRPEDWAAAGLPKRATRCRYV